MLPIISVIVPVYNVEKYLKKCIDSIINQTYKKIEIILIDDGSTDGSGDICDEYKKKDARIIVIHKDNGGQGSARNRGIDIACGEYICFVDSDDSVYENYIETLYDVLKNNDLDISACNYELYDENGNYIRKRIYGSGYVEFSGILAIESMWTQGVINIGPWGKLYKKNLWFNLRFKECFSEDWATMHYVYEKARKVGYVFDCRLKYLIRKNSAIRSFNPNKIEMIHIAEDNYNFAKKYPILLPAARQKAASVYFHILFQLPEKEEYNNIKVILMRKIKKIRGKVIFDKKCIRKTKIALMLSYLGVDCVKKIFYLIKKIDITF